MDPRGDCNCNNNETTERTLLIRGELLSGLIIEGELFIDLHICSDGPTDIAFRVGSAGHTFNVHKHMVLKYINAYNIILNDFWKQICPTWNYMDEFDNQGRLILKIWDVEPETFKLCVFFLYTGTFLRKISLSEGLDLLRLADQYEIPILLAHLSSFLKHKLMIKNCGQIYKALKFHLHLDFGLARIKQHAQFLCKIRTRRRR